MASLPPSLWSPPLLGTPLSTLSVLGMAVIIGQPRPGYSSAKHIETQRRSSRSEYTSLVVQAPDLSLGP